jgi:hypothetical protein
MRGFAVLLLGDVTACDAGGCMQEDASSVRRPLSVCFRCLTVMSRTVVMLLSAQLCRDSILLMKAGTS